MAIRPATDREVLYLKVAALRAGDGPANVPGPTLRALLERLHLAESFEYPAAPSGVVLPAGRTPRLRIDLATRRPVSAHDHREHVTLGIERPGGPIEWFLS